MLQTAWMGCLAIILLPIVEIALLVWLGGRIGFLPLAAFLLGTAILGSQLARAEGLRVVRQIQGSLRVGRAPEEGMISALLVFLGGVLLVFPGLVSDVAGVVLLLPPSRALVVRLLERRWRRMIQAGTIVIDRGVRDPLDDVIDVEAEPVEPPRPQLPDPPQEKDDPDAR